MAGTRRPPPAGGIGIYKPMVLAVAASLGVVIFLVLMVIPGRGQDVDASRPDATAITAPELALDVELPTATPAPADERDRTIKRVDEPLIMVPVSTSTAAGELAPTAAET